MLIPFSKIYDKYHMKIKGILHVGAHDCEEMKDYLKYNITNVYWLEAMPDKVESIKKQYNNVYHIVVSDTDDEIVNFNITNNGQSSSILNFGTHEKHHPHVKIIKTIQLKTQRLDTFIEKNNIPIENINFINLDIQGMELRALKSVEKYLNNIEYIYTEVNTEYVYENCDLLRDIDTFLNKYNFIRVETQIYNEYGWGDALYIKKI
jgi:FkbM family methyltransferase